MSEILPIREHMETFFSSLLFACLVLSGKTALQLFSRTLTCHSKCLVSWPPAHLT